MIAKKALLACLAAAACGTALAVPQLVSGGARDTVGSGAASAAVARPFIAQLSGANEVPPADPDGTGAAAVTVDPATGEVCVDLRVANIATAQMAHIHEGAAGVNGPIVVTLTPPTPTSASCVVGSTTLAAAIVANPAGYYVNVHTGDFPNGAVRGQLGPSGTTSGSTQLLNEPLRAYDSREVPAGILPPLTTRVVSLAYGLNGAGATAIAVPPGATGAILRVTVTDTFDKGFLKLYSNALANPPATSSVNWYQTGTITGADTTVAVDGEARIKVTSGGQSTHFVIDVVGYVF